MRKTSCWPVSNQQILADSVLFLPDTELTVTPQAIPVASTYFYYKLRRVTQSGRKYLPIIHQTKE
jgi:hypothetical protein